MTPAGGRIERACCDDLFFHSKDQAIRHRLDRGWKTIFEASKKHIAYFLGSTPTRFFYAKAAPLHPGKRTAGRKEGRNHARKERLLIRFHQFSSIFRILIFHDTHPHFHDVT